VDGDNIKWGDEMKFCIRESDITKGDAHFDMECESSDFMIVATLCLTLLKRNEGMFFHTLMESINESVNEWANLEVSDEDLSKIMILSYLKDKGE
jgi:hypothetical protein